MISKLHIETANLGGTTFLKNSYAGQPFKLCNITENKKDDVLRLMLMSSSPGILDADAYHVTIDMHTGSSLQLHTQSYQRLFTMKSAATQITTVHMADDTSFCFIPHPVVPHKKSSYESFTDLYLSEGCSLIFGEILTCGRKLNGEVFSFSRYHSINRIFVDGKLVIKENLLIQPALINPSSMGQLQEFTHQASLICLGARIDVKELMDELYKLLAGEEGISLGITSPTVNGFVLRVLGQKAEQLFNILKLVASTVLQKHCHKSIAYAI